MILPTWACATHSTDPYGSTYDSHNHVCTPDDVATLAAGLSFCSFILLVVISIWAIRWWRKRVSYTRRSDESAARAAEICEEKEISVTAPLIRPNSTMPWGAKRYAQSPLRQSVDYEPVRDRDSWGSDESFSASSAAYHLPLLNASGELMPSKTPLTIDTRSANANAPPPLVSSGGTFGAKPLPPSPRSISPHGSPEMPVTPTSPLSTWMSSMFSHLPPRIPAFSFSEEKPSEEEITPLESRRESFSSVARRPSFDTAPEGLEPQNAIIQRTLSPLPLNEAYHTLSPILSEGHPLFHRQPSPLSSVGSVYSTQTGEEKDDKHGVEHVEYKL